jgi:hypothetical protein
MLKRENAHFQSRLQVYEPNIGGAFVYRSLSLSKSLNESRTQQVTPVTKQKKQTHPKPLAQMLAQALTLVIYLVGVVFAAFPRFLNLGQHQEEGGGGCAVQHAHMHMQSSIGSGTPAAQSVQLTA